MGTIVLIALTNCRDPLKINVSTTYSDDDHRSSISLRTHPVLMGQETGKYLSFQETSLYVPLFSQRSKLSFLIKQTCTIHSKLSRKVFVQNIVGTWSLVSYRETQTSTSFFLLIGESVESRAKFCRGKVIPIEEVRKILIENRDESLRSVVT